MDNNHLLSEAPTNQAFPTDNIGHVMNVEENAYFAEIKKNLKFTQILRAMCPDTNMVVTKDDRVIIKITCGASTTITINI
jgi:hypothetical protein